VEARKKRQLQAVYLLTAAVLAAAAVTAIKIPSRVKRFLTSPDGPDRL
jgi:hypothetical protein